MPVPGGFRDHPVERLVFAGGKHDVDAVQVDGAEGFPAVDEATGVFQVVESAGEFVRGHDHDPGARVEKKRGLAGGYVAAADDQAVLAAQVEEYR